MKARLDLFLPARNLAARFLTARFWAEHAGAGVDRRYSRFVQRTKWLLPAAALGLLLLISAWPRIERAIEAARFSLPQLDLSKARDLSMVAVRYTGLDRQNRPFVVTAEVAHEMPRSEDLISLDAPKAKLTTAAGNWYRLTAANGIYQPNAQLLDLFGDVTLSQDKGDEFHSASAHVNMTAGTADGHEAVVGHGPFGHITAEGFRMLDRGASILFTGHADLTLLPRQKTAP